MAYKNQIAGPTHLYRLFDADGRLLYVGVTRNPRGRFSQHGRRPWWGQVDHWTTEELPTRREAFAAEARAIRDERPIHNIARPEVF